MASSNLSDKSTSNSSSNDIQFAASTGTFLVLFILAGTIGNGLIIVSILSSKRLRLSSLHLLTLNLAAVNLLECLLNMTFNLTTVLSADTLKEISTICKVNAFFINVLWIESILGITFMVVERRVAMKNTDKTDVIQRPKRVAIMITYTWVHSVAFSIPLATSLVPVSIYSDINSCLISVKSSAVYIGISSICCLVVPVILTLTLFIMTMRTAFTERSAVQAQMTRHQYSNDIDEPKFFKEFAGAKFSGILFTCWLFLVGPFIVAIFIHLYQSSDMNLHSGLQLSQSSIIYFILLWLKYFNVFMLPMFSLCYKKEFWLNFKDVLFCKKKNSVNAVANENNILSLDCQEKSEKIESGTGEKKIKEDKMKEAFIHNSGFQVPVLFATAYGVHIQTSESEVIVEDQGIIGKKCDVMGSQGQLQHFGDDTSDYDSGNELDPFSVSHPVSSKNLENETQPTLQHRSSSQPEVRIKGHSTEKLPSVTVTSAADSGLDISSSKYGVNHSSQTFSYDRSISCPSAVTSVPNFAEQNTSENSQSGQADIPSSHTDTTDQEADVSGRGECENHAYQVDTEDNGRCNNLTSEENVNNDEESRQILDTECSCDGQRRDSYVCVTDTVGAEQISSGVSSPINYRRESLTGEGNVELDSKMATVEVPATPSKKKKRHKKQAKGNTRNSNEDTSPPRPPPRLAPLQGCHPPMYQRMTETETDVPDNSFHHNSIESETGLVTNKAAIYEVKREKKVKNKTRQRNGDSETSLLDSGSSAELKCLKDAMFGPSECEGYSSQVLEVTTPSACKLMDLSKDFDAATPIKSPEDGGD